MEAFSDGVIAIIITVMVLGLRMPHGTTLSALHAIYPQLLAYLLSFANLGIYWVNHHHLLRTIHRVTGGMLWANLNLLFWLSLFPFATAWMSQNGFAHTTVAVYSFVLFAAAISYFVLQSVIVRGDSEDDALRDALGRDWKGKGSMVAYLAAIPLAGWWRWGSLAIVAAVAITWLIPDRRLEAHLEAHDH